MFVGPVPEASRSHAAANNANSNNNAAGGSSLSGGGGGSGSGGSGGSAGSRLGQDCLPRHEPLTEVRHSLADVESRATALLLNPGGPIDRVAAAAQAAAPGLDADIPLNRPLASIAEISQREAQWATNRRFASSSSGNGGGQDAVFGAAGASGFDAQRSDGAMEVFLAGLGVDMRETNRLLQYVRAARIPGSGGAGSPASLSGMTARSLARDPSVAAGSGGDGSGPASAATDVDSFIRAKRAESLGLAIRDVQQAMAHRERIGGGDSSSHFLRAGSADAAAAASGLVRAGGVGGGLHTPHSTPLPGGLRTVANANATPTPLSLAGAGAQFLVPESQRTQLNLQQGLGRATQFANASTMFPPAEWLSRFGAVAEKCAIGGGGGGDAPTEGGDDDAAAAAAATTADDLATVWQTLRRILHDVPVSVTAAAPQTGEQASSRRPPPPPPASSSSGLHHHPMLLAAAGARRSLEQGFFRSLLETIQWHRAVTPETVDPSQVGEAVAKYVGAGRSFKAGVNASAWANTFYALRCGQWRAAAAIAPHPAAQSAIRDDPRGENAAVMMTMTPVAAASGFSSSSSSSSSSSAGRVVVAPHVSSDELRELYRQEATATDPFRRCVLFLLLRGRTGTSTGNGKAAAAELADITKDVTRFIEDVLWIRLALIECIEVAPMPPPPAPAAAATGGADAPTTNNINNNELLPFHGLCDLQASVLSENPTTLAGTYHNSPARLAAFFLHAVLPATACRILLNCGGASAVDATHLAVCCFQRGLLPEPTQAPEAPLGFESVLQSFVVSYVTARCQSPARLTSPLPLLHTAYGYFMSLGLHGCFVNLCAGDEAFAAKLFGTLMPVASNAASILDDSLDSLLVPSASSSSHTSTTNASVSAAASNHDLLTLLNDVAARALVNGRARLAAQVSVIAYAHAAVLGRRTPHDAHIASVALDALSRAYIATTPDTSRALLAALASRCALVRPDTDFVVDGVAVRAGSVPIPSEVRHVARTIRDVVAAVGPLSVLQSVGGKLSRLADNFGLMLGIIDVVAAWDDRDDAAVVDRFWRLHCVPAASAQIDATTQMLNVQPEFVVILVSRAMLLVQHSLQRLLNAHQGAASAAVALSRGGGGTAVAQQQGGGGGGGGADAEQQHLSIARIEAQQELLRMWFGRWPQRCRAAGTGGSSRV